MSTHGKSDEEIVRTTHNLSRFCVENPQISLVLLVLTLLWGLGGFYGMPQRKDPEIPVRTAAILVPWPGNGAVKVEEQITQAIEKTVSQNAWVETVESVSRTGLSTVFITLDDRLDDTATQLDDIGLKLNAIGDLPPGAGPVIFLKDFGDTAALMLTVASPPFSALEVDIRARPIQQKIEEVRRRHPPPAGEEGQRVTLVCCWPPAESESLRRQGLDLVVRDLAGKGLVRRPIAWQGLGYLALDGFTSASDAHLLDQVRALVSQRLQESELHPDVWEPVAIRDPADTARQLLAVAPEKYSYAELETFTRKIEDALKAVPDATKVERSGVLQEYIYLIYSQERLASHGLQGPQLSDLLRARNIPGAGGMQQSEGRTIRLQASGEFHTMAEIGEVPVAQPGGPPIYLRDLVELVRSYEAPPRFLNFYTWRDEGGKWHRSRAITVSVQMRSGRNIGQFGQSVEAALNQVRAQLPPDLILARVSDQPQQVRDSVALFNRSLAEAIILVVVVSLIGFWEWRSAL
ncbi:MAG TPA: efflux RND transporter permease subunit, partial [Candidatus Nitrosotenuis sp.]|nr:efflux RND transporter permease subunit [Candidatus Nitrosotenuis sp.]